MLTSNIIGQTQIWYNQYDRLRERAKVVANVIPSDSFEKCLQDFVVLVSAWISLGLDPYQEAQRVLEGMQAELGRVDKSV
jgi:hypothetical protein